MKKHFRLGFVLLIIVFVCSACRTSNNSGDNSGTTESVNTEDGSVTQLPDEQGSGNQVGSQNGTQPEGQSGSQVDNDSDTESGENQDTDQEANEDQIIWRVDLNHDGIDDRIVVDIIDSHYTSEGAKINVYNGVTGALMYTATADLPHTGWNGFYLYTNENGAYLLNWIPGMWQGWGSYFYEVFSFNDRDEKVVLDSDSLDFSLDDLQAEHEGMDELVGFVQRVNYYLLQSWLIADTDDGTLIYGTQDNRIVNSFSPPAWLYYPPGF